MTTIAPATPEAIDELVVWQYGPPYEFYDGDGIPPLNPERFYEVRDDAGTLVGFYYLEERGDAVFVGLGLRPELTGRGLGLEFVRQGVEFARVTFPSHRVVLDVAAFNERAIKVYERAGFRETGRHLRRGVDFVDMELAR